MQTEPIAISKITNEKKDKALDARILSTAMKQIF